MTREVFGNKLCRVLTFSTKCPLNVQSLILVDVSSLQELINSD